MTERFFHGTSTGVLNGPAASGLRSPYLTDSIERAWYYAEQTAEEDGSDPAVVEVHDVETELLRYDGNAMCEPVMADETVRDAAWQLAGLEHPDWDQEYLRIPATAWQYSWVGVGSVRYDGVLARHTRVA